jgi:general secretion pathway protein I
MNRKANGFTLLEVLLALIIVSVALVAVVQTSQSNANILQQARTQTAGLHVANQVLLRLYQEPTPVTGQMQGQQIIQDQVYYWQAEWQSTDNARIQRLDVSVSLDRNFVYLQAQLTGFKGA